MGAESLQPVGAGIAVESLRDPSVGIVGTQNLPLQRSGSPRHRLILSVA